jgi:aminopeptidase-like protein
VSLARLIASVNHDGLGRELHDRVAEIYPICRSITGDGVRATLARLAKDVPVAVHEVPTGTQVLDWTVPREWNIRDAYVRVPGGSRVIDFRQSNLHVVGYSVPVRARMSLDELRPHLFTIPERPDWIPYRTSYYHETWGFCLSQRQLDGLEAREYEVCIDSSLEPGHLTYGEFCVPGATEEEVLVSTHLCHPSLANDNAAGLSVSVQVAKHLADLPLRYTYRFLFIPGTIGAITWLALNEARLPRIKHGLVLACAGDGGRITYKRSRRETAEIDRAVSQTLRDAGQDHEILAFSPYGYDERQFCSPGFDLPVGCLMRTPWGRYPEYHTSADSMELVRPEALVDSLVTTLRIFDALERNATYTNLSPKGEPQLGRRGLYRSLGGFADAGAAELAMLWVLNLSDGGHSLLDIAERSGCSFQAVRHAADLLEEHALLREVVR